MSALEELVKAEAALAAAEKALTKQERFNTGWRVTDALSAVRESVWTLQDPRRQMKVD